MQKGVVWLILLVGVLPCVLAAQISEDVRTAVGTGGAPVIIHLQKPDFSISSLQESIRATQDWVVSDLGIGLLDNDTRSFELDHQYSHLPYLSGKITSAHLELLEKHPAVASVELDKEHHVQLVTSIPQVSGDDVRGLIYAGSNLTGEGVTVCVVDSGIDYTHTDLGGCSQAEFTAGNCSKIPGGYDFVNSDNNPIDDHQHGTHVAGIVASEDATNKGVAPGAKLVAMKVCNAEGSCSSSNIIAGLNACVANASLYNISVVTVSIGSEDTYSAHCDAQSTAAASNDVANAGYFISIASGNDGSSSEITSPGCATNVTAVGAVNDADAIIYNRASFMKVLAPGVSVTSTGLNSGFVSLSGTSMATPHVAGAAALLLQYKRLESNVNLTPFQLENAFNSTGLNITDGSNTYKRLDILEALQSLDTTAPNITFSLPTPVNDTPTFNKTILINITTTEVIFGGVINWNGTNESINGSALSYYSNQTSLALGTYTYQVFGNDTAGNAAMTEEQIVTVQNRPPTVNVNITSNDPLNRTNGTLSVNSGFVDLDGDLLNDTQRFWYQDGSVVSSLENVTSVGTGNTTRDEVWTVSVRVFDGYSWGNWTNDSITIENGAPELSSLSTITVNETELVDINVSGGLYATEIDGDSLNFSYGGSFNASGHWVTTTSDAGNYTIQVNVTDAQLNDSINVTVFVVERRDADGDGTPDIFDTDDDNDGLNDTIDFVLGNVSFINTSLSAVNVTINSSDALNDTFNGTQLVRIFNSTREYVRFNFTFTNTSRLDLANLTFEVNNLSSGVAVSGVTLGGGTKSLFLDNLTQSEGVCLRDVVDVSYLSEFTSNCTSPREVFLPCPGSFSNYTCQLNSGQWEISGLSHSGAVQMNDTTPPIITSITPSGVQSTSETTLPITLTVTTNENATCRYEQFASINYSVSVNNLITRSSGDIHELNITYSADDLNETYYVLCNDSSGQIMTTPNSTFFSIDVANPASSGGGGGGGGGAGGGGGGGGKAKFSLTHSVFFDFIEAGGRAISRISNKVISISEVRFSVLEDVAQSTLTITKINDSLTTQIDDAYEYYSISNDILQSSSVFDVILNFRVSNEWINERFERETITLYRLEEDWTPLFTTYLDKDVNYSYYQSRFDGFSDFAIVGKSLENKTIEEIIEDKEDESQLVFPQRDEFMFSPPVDRPFGGPTHTNMVSFVTIVLITILTVIHFIFFSRRKKVLEARLFGAMHGREEASEHIDMKEAIEKKKK